MIDRLERFLDYIEHSNTGKLKVLIGFILSILVGISVLILMFFLVKDITIFKPKPLTMDKIEVYQQELMDKVKEENPYEFKGFELAKVDLDEVSGVNTKKYDGLSITLTLTYYVDSVTDFSIGLEDLHDYEYHVIPLVVQGQFNKNDGTLEDYSIH